MTKRQRQTANEGALHPPPPLYSVCSFAARYCAQFLTNDAASQECQQVPGCGEKNGEPPLEAVEPAVLAATQEYEPIKPQLDQTESRDPHSQPAELTFEGGAPLTNDDDDDDDDGDDVDDGVKSEVGHKCDLPCGRRLKVGFLSGFFYHHSVGLLVEGVVTRLDRSRFETTAIFLQPHPTGLSMEEDRKFDANGGGSGSGRGDRVYEAIRRETEHVLDLPVGR